MFVVGVVVDVLSVRVFRMGLLFHHWRRRSVAEKVVRQSRTRIGLEGIDVMTDPTAVTLKFVRVVVVVQGANSRSGDAVE